MYSLHNVVSSSCIVLPILFLTFAFSLHAENKSEDAILQEFLGIADTLEAGDCPFYGYQISLESAQNRLNEIDELLQLAPEKVTARIGDDFSISTNDLTFTHQALIKEKLSVLNNLCLLNVMEGNLETAVALLASSKKIIEEKSPLLSSTEIQQYHSIRATVYLRKAETENCIANFNKECCVFPLTGGGVHQSTASAGLAKESLLDLVALNSTDYRSRWLLNIIAMALGTFPSSVDSAYRLPASALLSDYDIGKFNNVANSAGVDEFALCGGAIALDYDNDGFLDIAASSWGPRDPLKLFRNNGDGTFEDRSDASGVSSQLGGLQIDMTDYNNDSFPDIFIERGAWLTHWGQIRNSLLRNNQDGTFTDVTYEAGLALPAYPTQAAAWGDFNNDGFLDLVVGNEGTAGIDEFPTQLFINNGNGTFTDVSSQAGLNFTAFVKGTAVGDYNNDGYLDIYFSISFGNCRLYRNNGNTTFTEVGEVAGVSGSDRYNTSASHDFPTWFFDYNNDGWLDIFTAPFATSVENNYKHEMGIPQNFRKPTLYRNDGDGTFTNVTTSMGLDFPCQTMGAGFGDLDNDGWLDMYLTTGDPIFSSLVPNVMLRNNAGLGYQDVTFSGGFGNLQKGHGVVFADFNNDGAQDVYHVQGGAFKSDKYFNALYANPGHGNRFLHLSLKGVSNNKAALGARVKVTLNTPTGQRDIHRAVGSVSSFGSVPFRVELGLGNASSIASVDIWWPRTNLHQTVTGVPMDAWIEVVEGQNGFTPKDLNTFSFINNKSASTPFLKVGAP